MCTLNVSGYDTSDTEEISENIIPSSAINTIPVSNSMPVCKKCGCQEIQVIFRNKNVYCKVCFLSMSTHKFRATLGKSRLLHPNDSILVAHSGKPNSTVLVRLVTANVNESFTKNFRFRCKVLYIDDGMVKGRTIEEREHIRNALAKEAENLSLTMYIVPLSKSTTEIIYEEIQLVNVEKISVTSEDIVLQKIFHNLENDTARDELLKQLKHKLLVSTARKLNCNKIFIADTSVDLAIKVLRDVSTGRGSQLSFNVAFSDVRYTDVTLLRPLRDFTEDDVTGYLNCYKLCPIFSFQECNSSFPVSIRNTTRNFVRKLDSEFYGTVSTIYRTSEKLASKINKEFDNACVNMNADTDIDVNSICILCKLTLDSCYSSEEQLSVAQAKLFSKLVSTVTDASLDMVIHSLNSREESTNEQTESINASKRQNCQCLSDACNSLQRQSVIEKYLCYSCKLIFLDSKQVNTILPSFILNGIQKKLQIARLRNEITDFLL